MKAIKQFQQYIQSKHPHYQLYAPGKSPTKRIFQYFSVIQSYVFQKRKNFLQFSRNWSYTSLKNVLLDVMQCALLLQNTSLQSYSLLLQEFLLLSIWLLNKLKVFSLDSIKLQISWLKMEDEGYQYWQVFGLLLCIFSRDVADSW